MRRTSKPTPPEIRFSDHFKLGKGQAALDFVDIPLNGDAQLFVDPYAFTLEPDPWFTECNNLVVDYFSLLIDAIRAGDLASAEKLLNNLHEPQETHLGFSKIGSSGRGIGKDQAAVLLGSLKSSQAVQSGKVQDLSDCELMIPGISADKISDITINIIRGQLIDYTESQCTLHDVPTTIVAGGIHWSMERRCWVNQYAKLPIYNNRKVILVPKACVRFRPDITAGEFYNKYVLDFLEAEHLSANDSLVHTLKNGTKKVFRSELKQKYPFTKELLFEISEKNPDIIERYKREVSKRAHPLTDSELELAHRGSRDVDHEKLAAELAAIPAGANDAGRYHNFVFGALQAVFYPALRFPQKEQEIHEGRKRIDITFNNGDRTGFFSDLTAQYQVPCPFVFFECKNYSADPANPELDQLAGRFGDKRGRFGFVVCRNVQDKALMLRRCKDTLLDGRGSILVLDDSDLKLLLALRSKSDQQSIDALLHEQMRALLM
jgi:hypothetical protein